jgi:large subunit ribosomal protein L15
VELHQLPKRKNKKSPAKRIGRGYGSGKGGHTVGRGMKGQKSRSGGPKPLGFEGGNVPLFRRLPKFRGFKNPTRVEYQPINFSDLENHFKDGDTVNLEVLKEKGMVRKSTRNVKILGKGELKKKFTIEGLAVSGSAKEVIEKSGGKVK